MRTRGESWVRDRPWWSKRLLVSWSLGQRELVRAVNWYIPKLKVLFVGAYVGGQIVKFKRWKMQDGYDVSCAGNSHHQ